MSEGNANNTANETWLEQDKELPGQKYVCLSFLSPEKVLANKDVYFFSKFLEDYEVQHKIQASEKFLMSQVQILTAAISKVEELVSNSSVPVAVDETVVSDLSGASVADKAKQWREDALKTLADVRAKVSRDASDDLAYYVKTNMRDFKETTIQEAFDNYLFKNRKKLEEEFFTKNEFRTSIRGMKVRGVYDSYAEAGARAKQLQKQDPYFNVYVGQVGFWLPWDPEPNEVADQEYAEDQLNTLMKSYKQNEQQKEALYEEEKRQRQVGSKVGGTVKVGSGNGAAVLETNAPPSDMFSVDGDLAITRKKEMAVAAAAKTSTLDM
jgi:hypothetical protein